ncbi:MAG TPA: hypothetical protein VGR87_05205 [Candidatus Limnocylindria bacterium]|nr:hypothetical protein [Candidatus Limnocylindria bacterium]
MRRASYLSAVAALALAGVLALAAAAFASAHALDPVLPVDVRVLLVVHEAAHWAVGGALFVLAAARLGRRPADAWIASALGAVVITVASFNAQSVPPPLLLAAAIAGAAAPWPAILLPPALARSLLVIANLALIGMAPVLAGPLALPFWLRTFAPIDPLTIPTWLANLPLQWPWIVAGAPVLFGVLDSGPAGCCAVVPVHSHLLVTVPAAVVGSFVWYGGRRRHEAPYAWHGPAGKATRRG